jgi:hypothetical protein
MDLQFKEIEHALISNPKAKLYIQLNSEIYSSLCWLLDMKRNKEHKMEIDSSYWFCQRT